MATSSVIERALRSIIKTLSLVQQQKNDPRFAQLRMVMFNYTNCYRSIDGREVVAEAAYPTKYGSGEFCPTEIDPGKPAFYVISVYGRYFCAWEIHQHFRNSLHRMYYRQSLSGFRGFKRSECDPGREKFVGMLSVFFAVNSNREYISFLLITPAGKGCKQINRV